jgi:DNA (cytosine-5)-methyltransferase 1
LILNKMNTFIDLFAGIGGFRFALESFGLKCVFSSEIDVHAQATYKANFGEVPHGDITKINETEIPYHDILCAGFPCQAFSISGKQRGFEDTRGTLFFEIARIAKFHQPKVLFLENVKNFERHNDGKTLKTVEEVLQNVGYNVFRQVLNANNFGLPMIRERIYIVAFRKDLNVEHFSFPTPQNITGSLKDFLDSDIQTAEYVINRNDVKMFNKQLLFEKLPPKPLQIGIINKGGQGERIYHERGQAITLSAHGGGVASKTGAYLVNGKIRKLSPRECARIMGFPEDFQIPVSDAQAYKQFGNSVAISVIKAVFTQILEAIGEQNGLGNIKKSRFANG